MKKFYKIFSLVLALLIMVGACVCPAVVNASETDYTYYVCSPGYDKYGTTNADGSKESPFETVYDLVKWVKENKNLGAGDTVNAIILQRSDYNSSGSFGSATLNGSSANTHSITSWSQTQDSEASTIIPDHEFTLVLDSPEGQQNYLAYGVTMASNTDMKLGGPTVFNSVRILNVRAGNEDKMISLEGHNATFTEKSDFYWTKMYTSTWTPNFFEDKAEYMQMYRLGVNDKEVNEPVNINLNGSYKDLKFYLPTFRREGKNINYKQDVTITVDNQYAGIQFLWGNTNTKNVGVATFEKNLNIDIKSAQTLTNASALATSGAVVVNALQVIKPDGIDFTAPSNVTTTNAWYLTNKTGNADALTFTETAGVYNVAEGLTVSAVDANGNGVKTSENGVLDLTSFGAGTYSIVLVTDAITPKMLYINSEDIGPLGQQVKVEGGATYIYSFAISNNLKFNVTVNDKDQRHKPTSDVEIYQISNEDKGKYTVYTYSITMPDKILSTRTGLETDKVIIGVKFGVGSEGYFANASLYKHSDENKTELLKNGDFKGSYLDYWVWSYRSYLSNDNLGKIEDTFVSDDKNVTLKVIKFDESKMAENLPKTMLYIDDPDNGRDKNEVLVLKTQSLKANVEYTVSFDYKFIRNKWGDSVYFAIMGSSSDKATKTPIYDNRKETGKPFASVTDNGTNAEYKFTLTQEQVESNNYFYVGLKFLPTYLKTQLYIADLTLYETADATKTNLCLSDEYETTVENWYALYGGSSDTTKQIFYREKGNYENSTTNVVAQYLLYDASLFKTPVDIHYGDADLDGKVDLLDLVRVDEAITNGSAYSINADANASGAVEKFDLNTIKRHLIGVNTFEWTAKGHGLMESANLSGGADKEAVALKNQIAIAEDTLKKGSSSNKVYYVAQNGKDSNSGTSQSAPITVNKIASLSLKSGDLVLFKRGDTFRLSEGIDPVSGVGYGAYGEETAAKPKLYGSLKNYANESLWTTSDNRLWKVSLGTEDATQVVFNEGKWVGSRKASLDKVNFNGDFYFDANNKVLYLYLNQINPGKYFDSIEIATTDRAFNRYGDVSNKSEDIKFENLDIRYFTLMGINLYFAENCSVTNCELGFIGGKYTESGNGYGNAIQFWRYANNSTVSNNYIYQIYDAAITFQGSADNDYTNLIIKNNLIEYCSMNFEFWGRATTEDGEHIPDPSATMYNIAFEDNILRFGGYGYSGMQRESQLNQAMVLAWNYSYTEGQIENFTIKNNIFDITTCNYYYGTGTFVDVEISGNTYYQKAGSMQTVVKGRDVFGDDITSFESEIKTIDNAPAKIAWVN